MGDIADALALRYLGPAQFALVNTQFTRGDITFRDLLHKLFEPIAATPLEIHASAQELTDFRPGFVRLVDLSRERNIPFTLASGGLDIYIKPALELLSAEQRKWRKRRANHAAYRDGGLDLSFPYADRAGSCGTCGSCKRAVITELQNEGYRVVAIGDGNADRCMADVADVLFARARLRQWCDEVQKPYRPFETLDVVVDFLESNPDDARLQ